MCSRKSLLLILVCLVGAGTLTGLLMTGVAQAPAATKSTLVLPLTGQIEVAFEVSLDQLAKQMPEKLMVYRSSPDTEALAQRQALERYFGKTAHFETAEASGGLFSADLTRLWAKVPEFDDTISVPSTRQLQAAADEFLAKIRGLPTEKTAIYVSTDTIELRNARNQRKTTPLGFNVTYRRLLGEYEVVGPGGKIKTFLDLNGQVAGYLRVWRKPLPVGEQALISIHQAAERLKRDPLGGVLLADVKKVVVTDARLAYFERGIAEAQQYFQPIYLFQCMAYAEVEGKSSQTAYVRYMEALSRPPELLWSSGRDHAAEERPRTTLKPGED